MDEFSIAEDEVRELYDSAILFHGHFCPAMPLGLRAGFYARKLLNVERAKDKELFVVSETSEGHAAGCFLDGVMFSTGCTFGKGNCVKSHYGKLAFTLFDVDGERAVRVGVNPETFLEMVKDSKFLELRKKDVPPQDIDFEIVKPLIQRVFDTPLEKLFDVSEVFKAKAPVKEGTFEMYRCSKCGELVFAKWIRVKDGKFYCIPCSYGE